MIEYFLIALFAAKGADAGQDAGSDRVVAGQTVQRPIRINANSFKLMNKAREAVWIGKVHAKRDDADLYCDRGIAHYDDAEEVTRMECIGHVEVFSGDRWAKGEHADFDNVKGLLVVTGDPEARQGKNHMKGTKVFFWVEEDMIEVENAKTIFEQSEKSKVKSGKGSDKAAPSDAGTPGAKPR